MLLIEDKEEFIKSFENPSVFLLKIDSCEKEKFIKSICKIFNFPDYISNWDALIDIMRGFYSSDKKDILIIIETNENDCNVIKDFDSVVEFTNEFLSKYSRKITFAVIKNKS